MTFREKLVQQVLDEERPYPHCHICGTLIDIEDDSWQATEPTRGFVVFLCGDCMREGFRLRGKTS